MPWRLLSLNRLTGAAMGVAFLLWCAASWFVAQHVKAERTADYINMERKLAERDAIYNSFQIESGIAYLRSIPNILASERSVVQFLSRLAAGTNARSLSHVARDRAMRELSDRLISVRNESSIDQIMILDADGTCVLAAGFESWLPVIGSNVSGREYFIAAREGKHGRQFAIGKTTGTAGLFFSAPVMFDNGFVGVVVIKSSLRRFQVSSNTLLTDSHGVILLSDNPALLFGVLPVHGALPFSDAENMNRYGRKWLAPIRLKTWASADQGDLMQWGDDPIPFIHASVEGIEDVVDVHSFHKLEQITAISRDGWMLFILLSATIPLFVSVVVGTLIHMKKQKDYNEALENLNGELAKQAHTDPLTGCANRRHFFETLDSEWQRAVRYGEIFSLATIDLDHFKVINDRFGHAAGDAVLRHFVSLAQSMLRPTDLLGRLGGEEFSILLPNTDTAGACMTAERIRTTIESSIVEHGGNAIAFTISAGVVTWNGTSKESAYSLLERSDESLYESKRGGRNRVTPAPEKSESPRL